MAMIHPCDCGHALDLTAALDAMSPEAARSDGRIYLQCPGCGEGLDMRLGSGRVEVGYDYFGGSMHFEVLKTLKVAGLKAVPGEPDDLDVTLRGKRWHFGNRTPSHLRFIVFGNAWASGRKLAELEFGQWDVTVEWVERGEDRLEPDPGLEIRPDDFLHLRGLARSLTRAWYYMNEGPANRK